MSVSRDMLDHKTLGLGMSSQVSRHLLFLVRYLMLVAVDWDGDAPKGQHIGMGFYSQSIFH